MRDTGDHLTDQDLLLAIDDELPAHRRVSVESHLTQCTECQARRAQMDHAAGTFAAFHQSQVTMAAASTADAREHLRARLHDSRRDWDGSWSRWLSWGLLSVPRWVMVGAAVATAILLIRVGSSPRPSATPDAASRVERDALPVATLTPGATWKLSVGELCAAGTREQRRVALPVRQQVLRDYGMDQVPPDEYELDYLITPELGGAPDPRNLWPQRYASRVWNAHVKDQLERLLPRLVCDGHIELETAQRDIALDWVTAYKKYFRTEVPLQSGAMLMEEEMDPRDRDGVMYPVWRAADAPTLELIAFSPRRETPTER